MRIIVISPESSDAREVPAMQGFLAAGLERYHVRKPAWSEAELEAWLASFAGGVAAADRFSTSTPALSQSSASAELS